MTEELKNYFNYQAVKEGDAEKFYVTYHADHAKAFYTFISECVVEASGGCFEYADDSAEFLPENISKKIESEVGTLVDGKRYFINTFHVYEESCCYSGIYFDMESIDSSIAATVENIQRQLVELGQIWGTEAKYKAIDSLGMIYNDEFEIHRKLDKAKRLEAIAEKLKG